jgi:hypothetical protein
MKEFIFSQFSHFEWEDINPGVHIKEALIVFVSWAFPAFIFVVWSNAYYPHVEFYQSAISEGIGPNLWNAIGSFGFFAFGVAIVFSKYYFPARVARNILFNTYAIGSLSFGLLLGQWWLLLANPDLIWWHRGLFGITSGFLLVIVFFYNVMIWYLCFLIRNESNEKSTFLLKLEQMNISWRIAIGSFMALLITIIFFSET